MPMCLGGNLGLYRYSAIFKNNKRTSRKMQRLRSKATWADRKKGTHLVPLAFLLVCAVIYLFLLPHIYSVFLREFHGELQGSLKKGQPWLQSCRSVGSLRRLCVCGPRPCVCRATGYRRRGGVQTRVSMLDNEFAPAALFKA